MEADGRESPQQAPLLGTSSAQPAAATFDVRLGGGGGGGTRLGALTVAPDGTCTLPQARAQQAQDQVPARLRRFSCYSFSHARPPRCKPRRLRSPAAPLSSEPAARPAPFAETTAICELSSS